MLPSDSQKGLWPSGFRNQSSKENYHPEVDAGVCRKYKGQCL